MAWQTIRLRNADGTSTVYRVQDSENTHHNIFHSSSMSSASPSLPPEVILGGSSAGGRSIHHYGHSGSPMSSSSMDSTAVLHYGHNTALHQPRSQTPVVILKPNKKRTRKDCAKNCSTGNNPLCITCGVILSLLVIIGYVSLIVVLIPGSTKNRWNEEDVLQSSMASIATADGGAGKNSQKKLRSNQDLMLNRASIATTSSSSAVDGDVPIIPRGHSYNAIVTILDPADDPQPNNNVPQTIDQMQEVRKVEPNIYRVRHDAGEPVRGLRRRKQKRKLV